MKTNKTKAVCREWHFEKMERGIQKRLNKRRDFVLELSDLRERNMLDMFLLYVGLEIGFQF